jgi:hypothetical protein
MIQTEIMRLAARFALLLLALPCCAAELEIRYGALERLLAEQLFTQEGRHYVRGNRTNKCQFAYLESPRVDSDNGLLRVRARFSGRSALDVMNRCIGMGDSFDLFITAAPFSRNGAIFLNDVKVSAMKDSYYIRRVRSALAQSISRDFKIEIREQARGLLEQPRDHSPYQQELAGFDLGEIRVTPDALVLVVEFHLVVK